MDEAETVLQAFVPVYTLVFSSPFWREQNGRVQCACLLTPHVTLFDGHILDSACHTPAGPAFLTLGDMMVPE